MQVVSWNPLHYNNILLTLTILLAFMTFSLSGGGHTSGSLVQGLPRPSPSVSFSSMPKTKGHHHVRHGHGKHKRMYFVVPNIQCPANKVRGHDGDCYLRWRDRRSIAAVIPSIDPCQRLPGMVQNHDGGCSRAGPNDLPTGRKTRSTFSTRKERVLRSVQTICPQGFSMDINRFCLPNLPPTKYEPVVIV